MRLMTSNRTDQPGQSATGWTEIEAPAWGDKEAWADLGRLDMVPALLLPGRRRRTGAWAGTWFLYADVDNSDPDNLMPIGQFLERFRQYRAVVLTSKSHGRAKGNAPPADRYHVLFPQDKPILDPRRASQAMRALVGEWPFFDPSVKDLVRYFSGSPSCQAFFTEGSEAYCPDLDAGALWGDRAAYFDQPEGASLPGPVVAEMLDLLQQAAPLSWGYQGTDPAKLARRRSEWVRLGMALKRSGFGLDAWAALSWDSEPPDALEVQWTSFREPPAGSPRVGAGTLAYLVRQVIPDAEARLRAAWASVASPVSIGRPPQPILEKPEPTFSDFKDDDPDQDQPDETPADQPPALRPAGYVLAPADWAQADITISQTKTGIKVKKRPTAANLAALLDFYGVRVRYNEMTHGLEVTFPDQALNGQAKVNARLGAIQDLLIRNDLPMTTRQVLGYLDFLAAGHRYHPVRDWLGSLPAWDGRDRIAELVTAMNPTGDPGQAKVYLRRWLVQAVASVCQPEGQVRGGHVLVLQGRQGAGKTTFFRRLAMRPEWFEEGLSIKTDSKDSLIQATTRWVAELGELDATFRRSDVSSLKAFLTREADTIRAPYAEAAETHQRRTVYCGTVNDANFLADRTGNRRFWVISTGPLDLGALVGMDYAQVWAQAHADYRAGVAWHLTADEEEDRDEINRGFETLDDLAEIVAGAYDLEAPARVTPLHARDVARELLGEDWAKGRVRGAVQRIAQVLDEWRARSLIRTGADAHKHRVYYLPDRQQSVVAGVPAGVGIGKYVDDPDRMF